MPPLNRLAKEIYEANRAKGFWVRVRSSAELFVLIQSELFEALEAERRGLGAQKVRECLDMMEADGFKEFFVEHIKDSFEDELADTVIRILDMAGAWNIDIQNMYLAPSLRAWSDQNESLHLMQREFYSFQSCVLEFSYLVSQILQQELQTTVPDTVRAKGANQMLLFVLAIAKHFRVNIWDHVRLKLAYNATRKPMHGKKY